MSCHRGDDALYGTPHWHVIVEVPGGKVWSVNSDLRRQSWRPGHAHRQAMQAYTRHVLQNYRIPRQEAVRVNVDIHLRGYRQADPQNYLGGSTIKAALDALTDDRRRVGGRSVTVPNGIVPDDRPEYMTVTGPTLHPQGAYSVPTVVLTISPREQAQKGALA